MPENYQNVILEIPEASGPYGAKGIGEIPLVPTAPAVANAVYDAVNVRVTKLPITPERILGLD
jgi:CO/xanthine dehydrogenase Mo-binding subunit